MRDNDKQFDRRSVLKTIGATAMVGAGLGATSGSAAARAPDDELARAYADETRLRFAFAQHGEGLRQRLVEAGFVAEGFDFGSLRFEIDERVTGLEPTAENRLAGVMATVGEGTPTAVGMASTTSDTHEIALFVQPERDEAYALVEPKGGGDRLVVTENEVSPRGCTGKTCTDSCCGDGIAYEETYECNSDCTDCWVTDRSCGCDNCECIQSGHTC